MVILMLFCLRDMSTIYVICFLLLDEDLDNENKTTKRPMQDSNAILQLMTHIPDIVINYNQKVTMPARKECIGVAMFADISGKDSSLSLFKKIDLYN